MEASIEEEQQTSVKIEEGAQSAELIADELEKLADAAEKLVNESGLSRRAILVLLRDQTGLGYRQLELVLDALPALRSYLS
jgi:hypothetical protein